MEDTPQKEQILRAFLKAVQGVAANIETLEMMILRELDDLKTTYPEQKTIEDPDVLGVDTLGRVIKRRRLSPEVIEKKRNLMKSIREQRLKDIEELKKLRAEKEAREKVAPAVAGGAGKKR